MDDSGTRKRPVQNQASNTQRPPTNNESLGDTVTGIVEDLQNIVRGEVQLAKTELKEDATTMGKAAGMMAAGAFVGLVGFIFLMLALAYLINEFLDEMWASAGIVALALLIIAGILAMVGKNKLSEANLKPEETIESVKEDKQWANQQVKSVKR